jgi:6-phosphogluconolactonase
MVKTIYHPDISALDKKAADIIAHAIARISKKKKKVVLAIPGGRNVKGIFLELKERPEIDWSKVHVFMVDERLVHVDSPQSNFRLASTTFLRTLSDDGKLPEENKHAFVYESEEEDFGLANYADELLEDGGKYDIVLLSAGEDGHIGALYPGHHSVKDKAKLFIAMQDSPKPPKGRMSASRELLQNAQVAVLLFYNHIKKGAYEKFLDKRIKVEACPAKLVEKIKESYVLTNLNK